MEKGLVYCMSVAVVMAICTRIISGCQCATRHPQQHFCESDFVIRAKVLEKIYEPVNGSPPIHTGTSSHTASSSSSASSFHPSSSSKLSQDTIDIQDMIKPSTSKPTSGNLGILLGGSPRLRMAERPRQQRYREATGDESSWNPWQYKLNYRVMVEKVYKGEHKVKSKTKVKLVSPADSGICGMTKMDEKTRYLITGMFTDKGLTVQLCNWVEENTKLTKSQRTGFKHMYKKYCNECTIKPGVIFWPPEAKEKDVCTYNPYLLYDDDCEGKHSACVRKPNGSCEWAKNSRMRRCIKRRAFPLDDTSQYTAARVGVL